MDQAQRTSKTALYALVFNLFPEKPPGLVGIQIFYFFNYFFYIFLRTDVTQAPTTKICTLNRGGMWPQNQEIRSISEKLENHLEASKLFLPEFF